MKKILSVILLFSSFSSFAQMNLNSNLSFSELAGSTLVFEFNWKDFARKISGLEAREIQKSDSLFCLSEYKAVAKNLSGIQELVQEGVYSEEQAKYAMAIILSSEKTIDLTCGELLGHAKAGKLKKEIVNL